MPPRKRTLTESDPNIDPPNAKKKGKEKNSDGRKAIGTGNIGNRQLITKVSGKKAGKGSVKKNAKASSKKSPKEKDRNKDSTSPSKASSKPKTKVDWELHIVRLCSSDLDHRRRCKLRLRSQLPAAMGGTS